MVFLIKTLTIASAQEPQGFRDESFRRLRAESAVANTIRRYLLRDIKYAHGNL